jgi:hypothetical protein
VLWCGTSLNLNFTYDAKDVPDGTMLNVVLAIEDFFANELVIAPLGSVVAPAKELLVQFPSPFPADWLGKDKLKDNAGSGEGVTIEIMTADKKISSYCGFDLSDPEFTIKCCPNSDAAKCGCDKCSCASNDQCNAGLVCERDGKCAIDLPGVGELCPAGVCERSLQCKCPEANPQCAATEKLCFGACPVSTAPGKINCPCNKGMCEAGLACSQFFCRPSATTPIATSNCQPSKKHTEPDECMQHPAGVTPVPHSCQTGRCAPCTPGATLCTCNSAGQCSSGTDSCTPVTHLGVQQLRCYPRAGCLGCPCIGVENACQEGICISAVCTRMLTPPPTQPGGPVLPPTTQAGSVSCTQKPGGNGCDCLKQGNQVGCGEMGLVCNKSTNKCQKPGQNDNAAQVVLPASAALLVGLATLL